MSTPRPALTDALLKDALNRRAAGPHGSAELIDDVLIAVRSTTQGRDWGLDTVPVGRPLVLFVAAALLLFTIVAGAVLSGANPFRRDPEQILTDGAFVAPFLGLPPEGTKPSTPETGDLVVSDVGIHPWYSVNVYADGRMIWAQEVSNERIYGRPDVTGWVEQRLTPRGVELLRTAAVVLGGQHEAPGSRLPASAWSDSRIRGYVPARYAICYWYLDDYRSDPANILRTLPDLARALLSEETYDRYLGGRPDHIRCHDVAMADAQRVDEILTDVGFERRVSFNWVEYPLANWDDHRAEAPEVEGYGVPEGTPIIWISPLLPHGDWSLAGG